VDDWETSKQTDQEVIIYPRGGINHTWEKAVSKGTKENRWKHGEEMASQNLDEKMEACGEDQENVGYKGKKFWKNRKVLILLALNI
jgi:hypothetical protein